MDGFGVAVGSGVISGSSFGSGVISGSIVGSGVISGLSGATVTVSSGIGVTGSISSTSSFAQSNAIPTITLYTSRLPPEVPNNSPTEINTAKIPPTSTFVQVGMDFHAAAALPGSFSFAELISVS